MTDRLVRLNWDVDTAGYKLARAKWPLWRDRGVAQECIVPLGGKLRQYEAHLLEHEIFRDLANSARRPGYAGALEFVEKWGLLFDKPVEPLERFLHCRDGFINLMSGRLNPNFMRAVGGGAGSHTFGPLAVRLVMRRGRPSIFYQARSLLQFCVLEYFQVTMGKVDLTLCEACGELLPIHKQGRPKRYCRDACKMAAYRTKHRDRINRTRRRNRAKRHTA
jgi:hypothetical protein